MSVYRFWSNGSSNFLNNPTFYEDVELREKFDEKRREIVKEYVLPLKKKNPKLPDPKDIHWKGHICQLENDNVDDLIQFYHDVVEEIKELEVE